MTKKEDEKINGLLLKADSVLLASMLHFEEVTIAKVKKFLRKNGISVRI